MLEHFLRIIRPGGTIWVGWNGSENDGELHGQVRVSQRAWESCLNRAGDAILFEILPEHTFFGTNEYQRKQTYSIFVAKIREMSWPAPSKQAPPPVARENLTPGDILAFGPEPK